jgi:hypothetical protein
MIAVAMTRESHTAYLIALLASILLHAAGYGAAQWLWQSGVGRKFFGAMSFPVSPAKPQERIINFVQLEQPERSVPRTFMETDPRQVTGEQPKEAEYFSDRATVAANPENPTGVEGDTPYLDGRESPVPSTEDVPFQPPAPAVAAAAAAAPAAAAVAAAAEPAAAAAPAAAAGQTGEVAAEGLKVVEEPKLAMVPKSLAAAQPAPVMEPAEPASGSQAAGQLPASLREIAAVKSRQTVAGISRSGVTAFNVAEEAFGPYMKQMVRAVQSRWYALIEQHKLYERTGHVLVVFDLYGDGRVGNLRTEQNTAGVVFGLFCEKAVLESSPFPPLPEKLRWVVGNRPREIAFAFYWQ